MNIPVRSLVRPAGRVVLATTGSLGEVFPFVAIGAGLRARGHTATVATSPLFRGAVEGAGVEFGHMRPDLSDDPKFQARVWDPQTGVKFWFGEVLMPVLRESFEDLLGLVQGADLLVSRGPALVAPLVAEATGIPWLTTKLSPAECLSAYDPPHPGSEWQARLLKAHPRLAKRLLRQFQMRTRALHLEGLRRLRAELGLPPSNHVRYWGRVQPEQCLMLFSRVLGEPQPDWPAFRQTGFVFPDGADRQHLPRDLAAFLDRGDPPIVFSLGSLQYAPRHRGFLDVVLESVRRLGRRAVLMTGADTGALGARLPEDVFVAGYAPYAALYPRAGVVVSHGGAGTIAAALRAGVPQLCVPSMFDQPDNAWRLERLGVGVTVREGDFSVDRVLPALRQLMGNPDYARRAADIALRMKAEQGLESACDAIEAILARKAVHVGV